MLQTKQPTKRSINLEASNERLLAIIKNVDRIQEESLRAWAAVEINQDRTKELSANLDGLLIKQEESFKKLVTFAAKA
ncbi:hypothetical protein G8C92_11205 [Paenibacillus donghaensis]|jgi:hypothetical protein|uniref:hypothetical protein n=1 Tax=Paenibacillus donghaensis TaxID=414771 RepID=UPI0018838A9E|nr:hypothetical protein [Paenibacillus donghaensis]MBE9914599.1 hypothetical protein [Paenibacillus donghaensis]